MRIGYRADQRYWLHVPSDFPTDDFPTIIEWETELTSRYVSSKPTATRAELDIVRELGRGAVRDLSPSASFGLQFWPTTAPIAVLLSVEVAPPLTAVSDPVLELLGEVDLAFPPSIERVDVLGLGQGISARFIAKGDPDQKEPPAGIGYVLSGSECAVRITSQPTSTMLVGLMDGPLGEVIATMRVIE